jgi:formyl-CoA transferase
MSILSGIRVLDLATYIAGPAAATIMSDFGAEVIKVERPVAGDPYRYLSQLPGMPVSDEAYCWLLDSRNKESLALDLAHPDAREVLERLVRWCDVLITNFLPAQLSRFGLGYEELKVWNSRLIYAQVSGYGESGEEAGKPGYDSTAYWARSGLMGAMHNAGADPSLSVAGFGDHPTAMSLFAAIMMALYQRQRTGIGMKVSTSLLANGAWSNSCQIQAAFCEAQWPEKRNRANPNNPLVNHYVTLDGQRILLTLLDPERDWQRLCGALGWQERRTEERYRTPKARRENARELTGLIDAELGRKDLKEWSRIFRDHDIIWALVPRTQDVTRDAQMDAAGVFGEIEGSPARTVLSPIHVDGAAKTKPRLAPGVGEHTIQILSGLGFPQERIAALKECGAVYAPGSS